MATIFDGIDDLIDSSLGVVGIGKPPHHMHKSSALKLVSKPYGFDAPALASSILLKFHKTWQTQRDNGNAARVESELAVGKEAEDFFRKPQQGKTD